MPIDCGNVEVLLDVLNEVCEHSDSFKRFISQLYEALVDSVDCFLNNSGGSNDHFDFVD